jgi:hypothetical protein
MAESRAIAAAVRSVVMAHLQRKKVDKPDEVRPYLARGQTEIYQLDDIVVGRMVIALKVPTS